MKRIITILVPAILLGFSFVLLSNSEKVEPVQDESKAISKMEIPGKVQTVLDKSCTMCHNSESKNTKGKTKLNFDHFTDGEYSKSKLAGKLQGVSKALTKGSMPPEKFLAKYPDKALTPEESKLLSDWATVEAKKLVGM